MVKRLQPNLWIKQQNHFLKNNAIIWKSYCILNLISNNSFSSLTKLPPLTKGAISFEVVIYFRLFKIDLHFNSIDQSTYLQWIGFF